MRAQGRDEQQRVDDSKRFGTWVRAVRKQQGIDTSWTGSWTSGRPELGKPVGQDLYRAVSK